MGTKKAAPATGAAVQNTQVNDNTNLKLIQSNRELWVLANQCADDCQRWATEYLRGEAYWRNEARHAAKNMHALAIQLHGGGNGA